MRLKLSEGSWLKLDGEWADWSGTETSGAWTYDKGELRLRGPAEDLVLANVHWNFRGICQVQDLTGKGRTPQTGIAWVMGKGAPLNIRLPRPPVVEQHISWKCWAASLESWLTATPGRRRVSKDELADTKYLEYTVRDGKKDGALKPDKYRHVMSGERIDLQWRAPSDVELLSPDSLAMKLVTKGYLYVPFQSTDLDATHVVVVFGIGTNGNGVTELQVMDPMHGVRPMPLSELQGKAYVGVGVRIEGN